MLNSFHSLISCQQLRRRLKAVDNFDNFYPLSTGFTSCHRQYEKQKLQQTSKSQPNFSLFWFGYKISELAIEGQGKLGQMGILGKLIVVYDD